MQRILQNLSVGNGNCNLAWNESSQETVFMNIYDLYLIFHDQKHSEQNTTFVRLFLFFLGGGRGCGLYLLSRFELHLNFIESYEL